MRTKELAIILAVAVCLFPVHGFGFFNPIDDVTDRITVVGKKIDGQWEEVEPGNGIDIDFEQYLDSLVEELEPDVPATCSTTWYMSDPVTQAEADFWNFDISNQQDIGWGGPIGGLAGGILGLACDAASGGEGLCTLFIGTAGALVGIGLERALREQHALPPLSCGYRLAASVTTCQDWSVPTPAPIQTTTTGYHAVPGSC